MHSYLSHLLLDIAGAHRPDNTECEYPVMSFEEQMEEMERWITDEEPPHTFDHYCGLKSVNFPPPEQLTDDEIKKFFLHLDE